MILEKFRRRNYDSLSLVLIIFMFLNTVANNLKTL